MQKINEHELLEAYRYVDQWFISALRLAHERSRKQGWQPWRVNCLAMELTQIKFAAKRELRRAFRGPGY